MRAARARLLLDVLGRDACQSIGPPGPWTAFCLLTADGGCVANIDAAILPLVAGSKAQNAASIRSVAVDPGWRGQGLFRRLMAEALGWCDARTSGPTLLYTEEPALYRRFGFHHVPQHAFVGQAPRPDRGAPARRLVFGRGGDDEALVRAAVRRRTAPSNQCALLIDAPQLLANLAKDPDLAIAYDAHHDAVIVYQPDPVLLTIVDIVSPAIPELAMILGALDREPPLRVKTLFPPDRLGWQATPIPEETGLMLRGQAPAAMTYPFMFPPTAEF